MIRLLNCRSFHTEQPTVVTPPLLLSLPLCLIYVSANPCLYSTLICSTLTLHLLLYSSFFTFFPTLTSPPSPCPCTVVFTIKGFTQPTKKPLFLSRLLGLFLGPFYSPVSTSKAGLPPPAIQPSITGSKGGNVGRFATILALVAQMPVVLEQNH